jgi:hypothetical protein
MNIQEVRKIIFERDENKCYKCSSTKKLTLDHVKPKSKYNIHSIDNIITLCWDCNTKKFIFDLPENELIEIQKYLDKVNMRFNEEESIEIKNAIEEFYRKPEKIKKSKDNWKWQDMCVPDKNGRIKKWMLYRKQD